MSRNDFLIEVVRLAEQLGKVVDAHMYPNDYICVAGETVCGQTFSINVTLAEPVKEHRDGT